MRKPKDLRDLFEGGSERLTSIKRELGERARVLSHVLAALPEELSPAVTSASMDHQALTIGAINAAWATRLRYATDLLRERVGATLGIEISQVRVRVQPAPKAAARR